MCGRFSLAIDIKEIKERFHIADTVEWEPRYNIAPTQPCLTIAEERKAPHLMLMNWGLIPHWSKDKQVGFQLINARVETVKTKPSFKESFLHRRCLIPADGFYEWKKIAGEKIPYRITLKTEEPFAFAGLWDEWRDEKGVTVKTFTILTTQANELLEPLHDRMPIILRKEDEALWLNAKLDDLTKLDPLFEPFPKESLKLTRVSSVVNSWKNDTKECIKPREEDKNLF